MKKFLGEFDEIWVDDIDLPIDIKIGDIVKCIEARTMPQSISYQTTNILVGECYNVIGLWEDDGFVIKVNDYTSLVCHKKYGTDKLFEKI